MKFARLFVGILLCVIPCLLILELSLRSRGSPITLSCISYSKDASEDWVAVFCVSNRSSRGVTYCGDGPTLPHYYLIYEMHYATNQGVYETNLNRPLSIGPTLPTLPPGRTLEFTVHIPVVYSNLLVGVSCFPERGPLHKAFQQVKQMVFGRAEEYAVTAELRQPFK